MKYLNVRLLAITCLLCIAGLAYAENDSSVLKFGGDEYLYRWSEGNQHEFTPSGQADLSDWKDMLTINVYPDVRDGDGLANVANNLLSLYKDSGMILKTDSVARTDQSEAEHMMVAVLGTEELLEAVVVRLRLVEGQGEAIVLSHRIYGSDAGDQMSKWLNEHGAAREEALMEWESMPALDLLGQ